MSDTIRYLLPKERDSMPVYRVTMEVFVSTDDAAEAGLIIEDEIFPIAAGDNPIVAISYTEDDIALVGQDDD